VLAAARKVSDDEWFHTKIVKMACQMLPGALLDRSPAEVSFEVLQKVTRSLGSADPFAAQKKEANARMLDLLPELREMLKVPGRSRLANAVRLSVAGNIMDPGIVNRIDVRAEIERIVRTELAIDDTADLAAALKSAKSVMCILDNAGEIVLDRLLIEEMSNREVTAVVRAAPVLSDVTRDDAEQVGLTELAEVIDPGAPMLGIVLDQASEAFVKAFEAADVVVSKGQANFETLAGCEREVFHILRVKCECMAEFLGVKEGDAVLYRREPAKVRARSKSGRFRAVGG
jgi:hypothetical protein